MKIYLACFDHDSTMRSKPEPEKAFYNKYDAEKYLVNKYNVQLTFPVYSRNWEVKEIDLE